jgi:hypothetical protein
LPARTSSHPEFQENAEGGGKWLREWSIIFELHAIS